VIVDVVVVVVVVVDANVSVDGDGDVAGDDGPGARIAVHAQD